MTEVFLITLFGIALWCVRKWERMTEKDLHDPFS